MAGTESRLVADIEACISARLTILPSDVRDRYSIEIAKQSLAVTRIEAIIREAIALNLEICGATPETGV